jgi:hypothetical protein
VWYGTSSVSGSDGKGGVLLRNETRGWEKRLATSSELRIGCKMVKIIESKDGVETYPEGVVQDKNNDTVGTSDPNFKIVTIFHAHGVTISSAARKGSSIHSNGALFLSGGKPIYQIIVGRSIKGKVIITYLFEGFSALPPSPDLRCNNKSQIVNSQQYLQ